MTSSYDCTQGECLLCTGGLDAVDHFMADAIHKVGWAVPIIEGKNPHLYTVGLSLRGLPELITYFPIMRMAMSTGNHINLIAKAWTEGTITIQPGTLIPSDITGGYAYTAHAKDNTQPAAMARRVANATDSKLSLIELRRA